MTSDSTGHTGLFGAADPDFGPQNAPAVNFDTVPASQQRARIIVLGNEKGGSGKSTVAMHLVVGLLREGLKVGTIDVDSRQATLTRYLENRAQTMERLKLPLPLPDHRLVARSKLPPSEAVADETQRFEAALAALAPSCDVVVIDTPGSDQTLSRVAHSYADTLVTPMNDSFIDLDLIAKVEPVSLKIICPSAYSAMVWDQKKVRAKRDGKSIDWLVLRNRVASVEARNKKNMTQALDALAAAGWTLGIATGKNRRGLDAVLGSHGLHPRFATLQTADSAPGKPDPTMIFQAMEEAGFGPENTVMIGDTVFDMAMARNAKVRGLGVSWGYHEDSELLEHGAERVLAQFADLLPALAR